MGAPVGNRWIVSTIPTPYMNRQLNYRTGLTIADDDLKIIPEVRAYMSGTYFGQDLKATLQPIISGFKAKYFYKQSTIFHRDYLDTSARQRAEQVAG